MVDTILRHAREAAKQFAGSVTVPIMYPVNDQPHPIGTGTLLSVRSRLFIITAAHLFEGQQLNRFYVPNGRASGKATKLIGSIVREKNADRVDVAVIELLDEKSKEVLLLGWQSISLDNVGIASPNGTFVLCGYPSQHQSTRGDTLECEVLTAFTERLEEAPANAMEPIDPTIDVFFKYAHVAIDEDGASVQTPHLRGTSGASIWEYTDPAGSDFWTPEKSLKVVAVQASAMDGEWFRATSWDVVKDALSYKDDELREAVGGL